MTNKLRITLVVIILLAVYAYFGVDYMKQGKEQETLTAQITGVSQVLAQMPEPLQDLEERLATARASLAAEQRAFPSEVNSTQVIKTILKLADSCEVKAIPLVTDQWLMETVGEHSYGVLRLSVAAEGSLSRLVSFIRKLGNGEFETLVVEGLSVARVTGQSVEGTAGGTTTFTANLDLAIYTQSLTSD